MEGILPLILFCIIIIIWLNAKRLFTSFLFKKEWKGLPFNKRDYFLMSLFSVMPEKTAIIRKMSANSHFPLSDEEIRNVLQKAWEKCPLSTIGIHHIYITDRPIDMRLGVRGSYRPIPGGLSGDIYLYAYPKDEKGRYLHGYTVEGSTSGYYIPVDEQLTKLTNINTLLHEMGHHYFYNKTRMLNGDEAEYFCDQFSTKMAKELHLTPGLKAVEEEIQELNPYKNNGQANSP